MPVLFNNCRGRNHAALFGDGAFFDLYRTGRQAMMALNLDHGALCIVASPSAGDKIDFTWFTFSHEQIMRAKDEEQPVRVFFGKRMRTDTLRRPDAIAATDYAPFFNIKGHFKQVSVVQPRAARSRGRAEPRSAD